MAFRKRNVGISRSPEDATGPSKAVASSLSGTRPSPLDGRSTTSTGTASLDALLAGHAGLPTGTSTLIEESGTTDYAGALARYFAAEGVVQDHSVHVLGMPEAWGRNLPGVAGSAEGGHSKISRDKEGDKERMKIAWRYEGLGEHGQERRAPMAVDRSPNSAVTGSPSTERQTFCHAFDLSKRLDHAGLSRISFAQVSPRPQSSPFDACLQHLTRVLTTSPPEIVHRLIIPSLLSPALYPAHASAPFHLLTFIHRLRGLLRQHPNRLVILITLPLSLYPRSRGLVRWMEHLVDGVLELTPFPHSASGSDLDRSGASTKEEDKPQGLVKVHKLPIFHERGGGGGGRYGLGEDLAFMVSRKKFEIRPFSLPPAEGDTDAQSQGDGNAAGDAKSIDF